MIDFQDSLSLALIIKNNVAQDRPNAVIAVTSNPGTSDDHYVALVQRVYADGNDLNSFVGYISYRYKEVRRKSKRSFLPEFSSIEILNPDFQSYNPPRKFHFHVDKVDQANPSFQQAFADLASSGITDKDAQDKYFAQKLGEYVLTEVYQEVLGLIDRRF